MMIQRGDKRSWSLAEMNAFQAIFAEVDQFVFGETLCDFAPSLRVKDYSYNTVDFAREFHFEESALILVILA